jgi:transcriptional regulator with XRE-family HTH domain
LEILLEKLAAKCNILGWDISRGTLSKIEAEIRRVNDAELLIIAKALRITPNDLMKVSLQSALQVARHGHAE